MHTCRFTVSRLPRVCDRDVECVCATMLRPIWRALNLYRFPFPGLCYSISGAPPCDQCNPLHLHHATPFLPLTARPSKRRSRTAYGRVVCVSVCACARARCRAVRSGHRGPTVTSKNLERTPLWFLRWRRISSMRRLGKGSPTVKTLFALIMHPTPTLLRPAHTLL